MDLNLQTELSERDKTSFDIYNKLSEIIENALEDYDYNMSSGAFMLDIRDKIKRAIIDGEMPHVTAKYVDPATQNNSHWGMKNAE